uniref:Serine aminopeptidase S33 domain-containing protein n=1 Tax=Babesia bovis TaxID=5865 RepID=A7AMZ8_BABBO|eukprot:XP_001611500.1 hypothetical protein [Babesia bovis T2Bo]
MAMIASISDEGIPEEEDIDTDYEVAKDQIYSEVKKLEDVFKTLLSRIFVHLAEYLKHKVAQSYLHLFIISPLGSGVGNLLNNRLNDRYITNKLGIPVDATPETFNLPYSKVFFFDPMHYAFQVDIPSSFIGKKPIRSWLIRSRSTNTNKAFILLHGWFGNMQSCLQFADTLSKLGCLDTHHILILDLHDDIGKSFETNIGLKGVTDIYDAAAYLQNELGVDQLSLYTQSISSLSALLFNEIVTKFKHNNGHLDHSVESACPYIKAMDSNILSKVAVDRIIMESPVANVRDHIVNASSDYVKWLTEQLLLSADGDGHHIDKLSLQTFLRNPETCAKVYIMQGSSDPITTTEMLHNELSKGILPSHVNIHLFRDGGHANLFNTCNTDYYYAIKRSIVGRNIWEILTGKGANTRIHKPDDLLQDLKY